MLCVPFRPSDRLARAIKNLKHGFPFTLSTRQNLQAIGQAKQKKQKAQKIGFSWFQPFEKIRVVMVLSLVLATINWREGLSFRAMAFQFVVLRVDSLTLAVKVKPVCSPLPSFLMSPLRVSSCFSRRLISASIAPASSTRAKREGFRDMLEFMAWILSKRLRGKFHVSILTRDNEESNTLSNELFLSCDSYL